MPYSGTISTAVRNASVAGAATVFDGGTLEIIDSVDEALVVFELPATAFTASDDGVMSLNGVPLAALGVKDGTAVSGQFKDSEGNIIASGYTVGLADTAIVLTSLDYVVGEVYVLTALTLTVPAAFPA